MVMVPVEFIESYLDKVHCLYKHSGGDEFLLDQAGTDVTELFEDTGHSEEARTILKTLQVGKMEEVRPAR